MVVMEVAAKGAEKLAFQEFEVEEARLATATAAPINNNTDEILVQIPNFAEGCHCLSWVCKSIVMHSEALYAARNRSLAR
jgi:non-ribosomal peptide synthetase component E (peptide arylation enzyme)